MTSLPHLGLVVLPLRTPGGFWREGIPTSPCILVGTPWQLLEGSSTTLFFGIRETLDWGGEGGEQY